ncbi:MAG TPA: cation transporter [Bacteroidales bacterium]|jgi:divalent metal cation (Fe/Co/Zn/Cd) transporter|nr:cation transporter [Bacteroidales bacterium]
MERKHYYKKVFWLAIFTIAYNFVEGMVSVWFGIGDESLALFGFGVDSFVEMISGIGILQMVVRIQKNPESPISSFERTALRITGFSFYLLAGGLVTGAVINILKGHKPETTFWGIVISLISIIIMYWLFSSKMSCGRKLNAEPVMADARCTLVCIYMSLVLLVSSVIYELTGFGWVDTIGALGLAWFSFSEGREAFEKA